MADLPAISVIIPLYNKGPYIARALNSILAQTFQDFEVIVVDDGSTDDGAEVVRGFEDPRIRLIQQENRGVSAARNKGIEEAKAELIAFLDADDEWLPSFLRTILRLREMFPDAGAYATAYYSQGKNKTHDLKINTLPEKPWEGIIPRYFLTATFGSPISSSSICVPKTVFSNIGSFIEGEWWGEDVEMWGRIALHYNIAFSWDYGAVYHCEAENRTNEKRACMNEHPFIKTGSNYIINNKKRIDPIYLDDIKENIEKIKLQSAKRALLSGERELAKQLIRDCNTTKLKNDKRKCYLLSYIPSNIYYVLHLIKSTYL